MTAVSLGRKNRKARHTAWNTALLVVALIAVAFASALYLSRYSSQPLYFQASSYRTTVEGRGLFITAVEDDNFHTINQ